MTMASAPHSGHFTVLPRVEVTVQGRGTLDWPRQVRRSDTSSWPGSHSSVSGWSRSRQSVWSFQPRVSPWRREGEGPSDIPCRKCWGRTWHCADQSSSMRWMEFSAHRKRGNKVEVSILVFFSSFVFYSRRTPIANLFSAFSNHYNY